MIHFRPTKRKPFTWVWRVEDEQGRGPYKFGNSSKWGYDSYSHTYDNGHPTIRMDFKERDLSAVRFDDGDTPECICGFVSLAQYRKWFDENERKRLAKAGFKIRRRRAAMAIRSVYQCLFIPYQPPKKKNARKGI